MSERLCTNIAYLLRVCRACCLEGTTLSCIGDIGCAVESVFVMEYTIDTLHWQVSGVSLCSIMAHELIN